MDNPYWDAVVMTRAECMDLTARLANNAAHALEEFQRGWREGARWRNQVHAEGSATGVADEPEYRSDGNAAADTNEQQIAIWYTGLR